MKLTNKNWSVSIDQTRGQITSIIYKGHEILYQQEGTWKKTFPVLFPSIGISNPWEHNGKKYLLPKHGFWAALNWQVFFEGEDLCFSSISNKYILPFTFDINMKVKTEKNRIKITATITNAGHKTAYFYFGWHPAFSITKNTILSFKPNEECYVIDKKGRIKLHTKEKINNKVITSLPFGNDTECYVLPNTNVNKVTLVNFSHKTHIYFDAPYLVFWKKPNDMFLCVEPWHGITDQFYPNTPEKITAKKHILTLKTGANFRTTLLIDFEKTGSLKTQRKESIL